MSAQNRFQRTAVRQERNRLRDFQLLSQTSFFNKELRNINDAYLANWVLEWFSSHSLPIVQSFLSKRDGQLPLGNAFVSAQEPRGWRGRSRGPGLPRSAPFCPELQWPAPRFASDSGAGTPPSLPGVCRV